MTQFYHKGSLAADDFLQSRIVDKSVAFHSPMKKLHLKTFAAMAVKKVAISQQKSAKIKVERNLFGTILQFSQKVDINLEQLFTYPMSPVPWSLATADGTLMKTDKSQLLHHIERKANTDAVRGEGETVDIAVVDGNAVYQSLSKVPPTFGELAAYIFRSFLPPAPTVHFVTDNYPVL